MLKRYTLAFCFVVAWLNGILAQENQQYIIDHSRIDHAKALYESSIVGLSKQIAHRPVDDFQTFMNAMYLDGQKDMDYIESLSLLKLDESTAEARALINQLKYDESKYDQESLTALADFYYVRNDYKKAVKYYDLIDYDSFTSADISFRQAYSHFVLKEFAQASKALSRIKNLRTNYYYPANYYYAMSAYFQHDYKGAIKSLEIVKDHPEYSKYTPYYLAQLYFAQNELDKLIGFVEPALADYTIYKRYPLHSILGQAYIQKGDYEKGLHYLELYEQNTEKLTDKEFYQIALSHYNLGNYRKAANAFEELSNSFNDYQVSALYHLADCHLKRDDKQSAKNVFKYLAESNIIPKSSKDLAFWNFARLSVETGNTRESINALRQIIPHSKYYAEARGLLVKQLLQGEDYTTALEVLEEIDDKDNELKSLYQEISLRKAKQLFLDGEKVTAKRYFAQVEKYPLNKSSLGESYYWMARIDNSRKNFKESNKHLHKFFELKPTGLPHEASQGMAHYLKAYNHFELEDFGKAAAEYRSAINSLKADILFYDKGFIDKLLLDTYSRKGDAHLSNSEYNDALVAYHNAAILEIDGSDYGLYQKGLIEGLQGSLYDKILSLEELSKLHVNSPLRDNALLHLGDTYLILNKPIEAIESYQTLVEEYKNRSDLVNQGFIKLGITSYNLGDANKALEYYESVLINQPTPEEKSQTLLAMKEIYVENLANPEAYFELAEEQGYEVSAYTRDSLSFSGAKKMFSEQQYNDALIAVDQYLDKYPNGIFSKDAYFIKAESNLALKKYGSALLAYERLIAAGPSTHYQKALENASVISYNFENNFLKSYEYYDLLHELELSDAQRTETRQGALRSAFRNANQHAVIKYASLLIEDQRLSQADLASTYFYLAKAHLKLGQTDQAVSPLNQVIRISRNNQAAEASYMISEIFYNKQQLDLAETQALETTKRSANYPYWVSKSLLLLADIYRDRGDYLNAKAALEALLENYTEDEEVTTIAKEKLQIIEAKITESNRIKTITDPDLLELDTLGNG